MIDIFISHSSIDESLVRLIVKLIKNTTKINTEQIRCTTLSDYGIKPGSHVPTEIKRELEESKIILGIITHNSLASEYVMFELGAGWLQEKSVALLESDIDFKNIPGPIRENNAIKISEKSDVYRLIDFISEKTSIGKVGTETIEEEVGEFILKYNGLNQNKIYKFEKIHPVPGRTYYPQDFNKVWPQTMFIEDKFWSISLMHPKMWKRDVSVMGIYTLGGVKHVYSDASIRRIFVLYYSEELEHLESTIKLHLHFSIKVRFITIDEYKNLCQQSCEIIDSHIGTKEYCIPVEAFTISHLNYPTEFSNDLCIIHYNINQDDRRVESFTTIESNKKEESSAYTRFYKEIWSASKEITTGNFDDLLNYNL
jgi:hypothetical protein